MIILLVILVVIGLLILLMPTRENELKRLFELQTKSIIKVLSSEMTDEEFIQLLKLENDHEKMLLVIDILKRIRMERGLLD